MGIPNVQSDIYLGIIDMDDAHVHGQLAHVVAGKVNVQILSKGIGQDVS